MSNFFHSLFDGLRGAITRLPRVWRRALLIGLPFATAALATALILPGLLRAEPAAAPAEAEEARLLAAETPEPAPTPTPAPTPSPEPTPTPAPDLVVQLKASSSELDMRIFVLDEQGELIRGVEFPLLVTYPDGSVRSETTDLDGLLYRDGVEAGEYRVALAPVEGYHAAAEVLFKVIAKLAYEPISDVREQTEVRAVTDLPTEEVKPAPVETPAATVVESISTEAVPEQPPAAPDAGGEILIVGEPEPEPAPAPEPEPALVQPDPYYEYSYAVGPNGMLLLADGSESDVYPVLENGWLYGLRRVVKILRSAPEGITEVDAIPLEPEPGVEYYTEESSEVVQLLYDDGSPVPGYQITATLVVPDPVPAPEPAPAPAPPPEEQPVTVIDPRFGWQNEADGACFYDIYGNRVTGLKEIDGRLYYFTDSGVQAGSLGIDVSYFNGPIDWNQVKAHGIDFVIVRVAGRTWGSGILFEDENSYLMTANGGRYLQEARAAGLKIGAYVWSSAVNTNEAVEEASLALQILGGMPLDLPLYIDMEYSGDYPNGRADQLSPAERTEIVHAFCATVASGGYRPGVYAGQYYWQEAIDYAACSGYDVWMASYTVGQRMPAAFPWSYHIWQCTASAYVRGIEGYCDLDVIF